MVQELTLGELIDKLYVTREQRLSITKQVDALKVEERDLRDTIISALYDIGLEKASGSLATCGLTVSVDPVVTDWDKVHEYIRENNRFDLLQKRLSVVAWRDLANEEGLVVPGTESTTNTDVSLTKSHRG